MKIRTDFVTNSSSSSYIIAYKQLPQIDEETIKKYPFLKNYSKLIDKVLFTAGDDETTEGEKISTKEELDSYFINNYGFRNETIEKLLEDDEDLLERYNYSIKYIEDGFAILIKSVDYNDSYCSNMLNELAEDKDNFIILEGD